MGSIEEEKEEEDKQNGRFLRFGFYLLIFHIIDYSTLNNYWEYKIAAILQKKPPAYQDGKQEA